MIFTLYNVAQACKCATGGIVSERVAERGWIKHCRCWGRRAHLWFVSRRAQVRWGVHRCDVHTCDYILSITALVSKDVADTTLWSLWKDISTSFQKIMWSSVFDEWCYMLGHYWVQFSSGMKKNWYPSHGMVKFVKSWSNKSSRLFCYVWIIFTM